MVCVTDFAFGQGLRHILRQDPPDFAEFRPEYASFSRQIDRHSSACNEEVAQIEKTLESAAPPAGEYLNYSPKAANTPENAGVWQLGPSGDKDCVPPRSQPVTITPLTSPRTGLVSYRVMGTLKPRTRQSKRTFSSYEAAEEKQLAWETVRMHGAAAARPKITSLTLAELREAEAAFMCAKKMGISLIDGLQMLSRIPQSSHDDVQKALQKMDGEPFTLTDAVKFSINGKLRTKDLESVAYDTGLEKFLAFKKDQVSKSQYDTLAQRGRSFGRFLKAGAKIEDPGEAQAIAWLEGRTKPNGELNSKKTWNNLRADLSTIFRYFVERKWRQVNPFAAAIHYNKKSIAAPQRHRLEIGDARELMAYVEEHHPEWACYFALTLFAGIRPDMRTGEMWELAKCAERDGPKSYYSNGKLHLSAEITKERVARETTVHPNLAAWLAAYPLTKSNVRPGDYKDKAYQEIRGRFDIQHDGLRHTAISAFISSGKNHGEAADEFGNSEPIIRRHYLKRMSLEEAKEFYEIYPKKAAASGCGNKSAA